MKVVLLAGGFGTRISEESQFKPKPMIEIGGMPISDILSLSSVPAISKSTSRNGLPTISYIRVMSHLTFKTVRKR